MARRDDAWEKADDIVGLINNGLKYKEIASLFNCSLKVISGIATREKKKIERPKRKKINAAWLHAKEIIELYKGGMMYREIVNRLSDVNVKCSISTVEQIVRMGTLSDEKRDSAWNHVRTVLKLRRDGLSNVEITRIFLLKNIDCNSSMISNIASKFEVLPKESPKVIQKIQYPEFQKSKEYKFADGRNFKSRYVFLDVCPPNKHRSYPLYMFKGKKSGAMETFTPMQIRDLKVEGVGV